MVTVFHKMLGVYFGNFLLDNFNWDEISHSVTKRKSIIGTEYNSFWDQLQNLNQILLFKLLYKGQIYAIPKFIKNEIEKTIPQFPTLKCVLVVLDIDT